MPECKQTSRTVQTVREPNFSLNSEEKKEKVRAMEQSLLLKHMDTLRDLEVGNFWRKGARRSQAGK